MSTKDYTIEKHTADVLIIGGGVGGLAAAIRAAESGVDVLVLEKANTRRSGLSGSGIDHIQSYIPEFHEKIGYSVEDFAEDQFNFEGNFGGLRRRDLSDLFARRSAVEVRRLEEWGLRFKLEDGDKPGGYFIVPQFHHVPTSYNFAGRDIKVVLTTKATALGVRIINRAQVRLLLKRDNAVVGAVAISTREAKVIQVLAKTTILSTSNLASRLLPNSNNPESFESFGTPGTATGAGKLLAAKAGARVQDLEFLGLVDGYVWDNYSFTVGAPSGTWWPAGRVVDEDGEVVVERNRDLPVDEEDYIAKYAELVDHYYEQRGKIAGILKSGKSLYFDLREGTPDEQDHIWWSLGHEGKTNVLKHHIEKNDIDWRTARFPLRLGGKHSPVISGIYTRDDTLETDVANLYAGGNEAGGIWHSNGGAALVLGFRAGESAAERARSLGAPSAASGDSTEAGSLVNQAVAIRERKDGITWQQAERALHVLLENELRVPYARSAVEKTLKILRREKARLVEKISAGNPHELSRVFEVLDLYDLAELTVLAILERRDSLGPFVKQAEGDERYGDSVALAYINDEIVASRVSNLVATATTTTAAATATTATATAAATTAATTTTAER
jgi:succinate dehydrogenase/fumarate reductase flavoprotein subunit